MNVSARSDVNSERPFHRLLIAWSCTLLVVAKASAAEIWVITDRQHPVKVPPGARLIELDAASAIAAELSTHLPADANRAADAARQRLKKGGTELQRRLANAYQGVVDAWSLGIETIPAVVVDRRYVVYGESDARRALSLIENYRSKQR